MHSFSKYFFDTRLAKTIKNASIFKSEFISKSLFSFNNLLF